LAVALAEPAHLESQTRRPRRRRSCANTARARVASWTSQSAIHASEHSTRATTKSQTHTGGDLQPPLGNCVSPVITAWALEWQAGPGNQRSTPLSTSLSHPPQDTMFRTSLPTASSRINLATYDRDGQSVNSLTDLAQRGTRCACKPPQGFRATRVDRYIYAIVCLLYALGPSLIDVWLSRSAKAVTLRCQRK